MDKELSEDSFKQIVSNSHKKGIVFGVIGASGVGKTTLIRSILAGERQYEVISRQIELGVTEYFSDQLTLSQGTNLRFIEFPGYDYFRNANELFQTTLASKGEDCDTIILVYRLSDPKLTYDDLAAFRSLNELSSRVGRYPKFVIAITVCDGAENCDAPWPKCFELKANLVRGKIEEIFSTPKGYEIPAFPSPYRPMLSSERRDVAYSFWSASIQALKPWDLLPPSIFPRRPDGCNAVERLPRPTSRVVSLCQWLCRCFIH